VQDAVNAASKHQDATYVSDPVYAGADVPALVAADGPADEDKIFYLFAADATTMNDPEHPLLAVDLADEPGRTFRVLPAQFPIISANLCIANLEFAAFADAADDSGTYRESSADEEYRLQREQLAEKPWLLSGRPIYVLEGTQIGGVDDFWRVWLEAVGSDGEHFIRTLPAFDDILSGGPGWPEHVTGTKFIVEWRDHEHSQAALGRSFRLLVKIFERRVPGSLKLC
jgi:hypothetical protein